jgi:guanylate kinase
LQRKNGLLIIISSPSGGGKTTIIKELLKDPELNAVYSISVTTRAPRDGEQNGVDYWFVTPEQFHTWMAGNKFIEHESVHNHSYGTLKQPILDWINTGRIVFLDLDVYGALSLKNIFADDALLIFLKPPDLPSLEQRLRNRSTESPIQIEKRLQRVAEEMELGEKFEFIVINETINNTVLQVKNIIREKLS